MPADADSYGFIVIVAHPHLFSRWLQHLGSGNGDGKLAFAHSHTGTTFGVCWEKSGVAIERLNDTRHLYEGTNFGPEDASDYLQPLGS